MKLINSIECFDRDMLQQIASANHSGVCAIDGEHDFFQTLEMSSVIRHKFTTHTSSDKDLTYFNFTFQISSSEARPTHISVVNEDVTDGAIWETGDALSDGLYSLSAVLKSPCESFTIYANFAGQGQVKFVVTEIVKASFRNDLKIGFVIDPWLERSEPTWKDDYIWWFGKLEQALRQSGVNIDAHYVMSDAVAVSWEKYKPTSHATHSVLETATLSAIFPDLREAICAQRQSSAISDQKLASLGACLKKAFPWDPDVIVAMSDMQILKQIFPSATILYRDALYCREPFQDELTSFDLGGLYQHSSIADICAGVDTGPSIPNDFLSTFYPTSTLVDDLLKKYNLNPLGFHLLPLQDSRHYNFYDECKFENQFQVLEEVARRHDTPIVFTQHPDRAELTPDEIAILCSRYSNLVYIPELEGLKNPSARLLPYASSVLGVSTGVLMQALICGKAVSFLGHHPLAEPLEAMTTPQAREGVAYQFLTRYFSSYSYLHNSGWLLARLISLHLYSQAVIGSAQLAIDLPQNVFKNLISAKRPLPEPSSFNGEVLPKIVLPPMSSKLPENGATLSERASTITRLTSRGDIVQLCNHESVGVELGVAEGVFSERLLSSRRFRHLFSIDMFAGDRGHDVLQYCCAIQRLSPYSSTNSIWRMRFEEAVHLFQDGTLDFVYVDGYAHTGQENGNTLEQWFPKVRAGGIFSGHDYSEKFPLVVAEVNNFAHRHHLELHLLHDEENDNWNHGASSWVIFKP